MLLLCFLQDPFRCCEALLAEPLLLRSDPLFLILLKLFSELSGRLATDDDVGLVDEPRCGLGTTQFG